MQVPSHSLRLWRRTGVLLLGLAVAATGLPAVSASADSAGPVTPAVPADGAGYVDFAYGDVADDVTAHTSQSKVWFYAGSWWAVMMEPAASAPVPHESRWAIYRLDVASQTWLNTNIQVDERNQSHPDVLSWGDELYVVSSYSRRATEPVKVFKFNYMPETATYVLDGAFENADTDGGTATRPDDGVETEARGVRYATIARQGDTLLIAYTAGNQVWYMTSTDGAKWEPPAALPAAEMAPIAGAPGATASSDDIAAAVTVGGSLGIFWSRTSTTPDAIGGFYFAKWNGSGFDPVEKAWDGLGVGDNHLSVRSTSDGGVLAAVKTSLKGADDPLVSVLRRTPTGTWDPARTVITRRAGGVEQDATRPVLAVDDANAHVLMTDRVDGGAVYRNSASLSDLAFSNGMGTPFIRSSAQPFVNDVSTTKQQLDAATGIIGLASDDTAGTDRYLHGCTGASCPAGGIAPPPVPSVATSTTLSVSPNPSVSGGAVTLSATVTGGSTAAAGSITFLNGGESLKTVGLTGGTATMTTTSLSTGTHALKAVYSGSTTHLPSESAVVAHRVVAGSGAGAPGEVSPPPPGSRLKPLPKPKRVVSAKRVGPGKVVTVRLPAVAELRGAAINVTVAAGKRRTRVAVCPGNVTKAACKSRTLLRAGAGERKAKFTQLDLAGPALKLFNAKGRTRITVDVQGWYVMDQLQPRFTGLSTAQRVVADKRIKARGTVKLRIPASMRPAGTVAVELFVRTGRATRGGALAVCRTGATTKSCLSRPTLYTKAGSRVGNLVVVPLRSDGTVKIANRGGAVRAGVYLMAVVTTG